MVVLPIWVISLNLSFEIGGQKVSDWLVNLSWMRWEAPGEHDPREQFNGRFNRRVSPSQTRNTLWGMLFPMPIFPGSMHGEWQILDALSGHILTQEVFQIFTIISYNRYRHRIYPFTMELLHAIPPWTNWDKNWFLPPKLCWIIIRIFQAYLEQLISWSYWDFSHELSIHFPHWQYSKYYTGEYLEYSAKKYTLTIEEYIHNILTIVCTVNTHWRFRMILDYDMYEHSLEVLTFPLDCIVRLLCAQIWTFHA